MSRRLRPLAALGLVALITAGCGAESPSGTETTAGASSATSTSGSKKATGREKAVKFSECMRDNGVSAFPDPDASGELTVDGVVNGSSIDSSSASWERAISACKDLQPAGFTGRERTPEQQSSALEFAECMRENGVTDFPDPVKGEPLVDTRKIPSAEREGGMNIINAAMRACRSTAADIVRGP